VAFRYEIHLEDGSELGGGVYADSLNRGELVLTGPAHRYRILEVIPLEDEDDSPYAGLLRVEAA
jgi:hypothetical protein